MYDTKVIMMDELRERFEEQKKEFFSELTFYERKTKSKVTLAVVVFLLMSMIIIFNVNQFYNINPPVGYFVLVIVLFMIYIKRIIYSIMYLVYSLYY